MVRNSFFTDFYQYKFAMPATNNSDNWQDNSDASTALRSSILSDLEGGNDTYGPEVIKGLANEIFGESEGPSERPQQRSEASNAPPQSASSPTSNSGQDLNEPFILYKTGQDLLNSYTDVQYFPGTFPTLFWTGGDGHLAVLKDGTTMDLQSWAAHFMKSHNRAFAQHEAFLFLVFNTICRNKAAVGRSLIVKRKNWESASQAISNLSREQLLQAAESLKSHGKIEDGSISKNIWTLMQCVQGISRVVPLSTTHRTMMRRNIKGFTRFLIFKGIY
jgi:hypothetical protein